MTRQSRDEADLVRFVTDPAGRLVPDLSAKLPGRGMWVTADRAVIIKALEKNAFARAAKQNVQIGDDQGGTRAQIALRFLDNLVHLLEVRILDSLGLAKRAGRLVHGRFRVEERIGQGPLGLLIEACDAADDGRMKLRAKARTAAGLEAGADVPRLDCLTVVQLSLALGAENVVHAALDPGALAARLRIDAARLTGLYDVNRSEIAAGQQAASGS